jgi:hypothetical protein
LTSVAYELYVTYSMEENCLVEKNNKCLGPLFYEKVSKTSIAKKSKTKVTLKIRAVDLK